MQLIPLSGSEWQLRPRLSHVFVDRVDRRALVRDLAVASQVVNGTDRGHAFHMRDPIAQRKGQEDSHWADVGKARIDIQPIHPRVLDEPVVGGMQTDHESEQGERDRSLSTPCGLS